MRDPAFKLRNGETHGLYSNRAVAPCDALEIADALKIRFHRMHGQELTPDKVRKAFAGSTFIRRQIEEAGGASVLPRYGRQMS